VVSCSSWPRVPIPRDVQHLKSLGFDVRVTGNEREVVFAARDADGKLHVVKGPIDQQFQAVCELAAALGVELEDG